MQYGLSGQMRSEHKGEEFEFISCWPKMQLGVGRGRVPSIKVRQAAGKGIFSRLRSNGDGNKINDSIFVAFGETALSN
jgi:hypothetical protein